MKFVSAHTVTLFMSGCKKLWKISPYFFISIFILSLINGTVYPLSAIAWQYMLDTLVYMLQTRTFKKSILLILLAYSALNFITFLMAEYLRYLKQTYSDMVGISFTTGILQKSADFPMEIYDNPTIYDHLHIALDESSRACLSILDIISGTVQAVIQLVSFIIIVAQLNWLIAVTCIISALPLLYMNIRMGSYWHNIYMQRAGTNRYVKYLKMILTKNENIKEAKLYKLSERLVEYIKKTYEVFLQSDKTARKNYLCKMSSVGLLDEFLSWFVKAIIIYVGIAKGSSIGRISLYFNSQSNLKSSVTVLFDQISELHSCILILQSLDIIEKIENDDSIVQKGERPFPGSFNCIEFKNVSFRYPNSTNEVLKNLSFKFENGKTYSIVGLNGAGKTTLIKLLLRLYPPTEGEILIDGENIESINLEEYYNQVSAVFQDFLKLPFSLYENVTCKETYPDLDKFFLVAEIADISQLVQVLPQKERTIMMKEWANGVDISQGQWQRVAIARCCYGNCAISIFDEPFSSIDAKTEAQIIDRIADYRKGKLTIYITHQFTSISLADQIIVIKDGRLVETGTHQELVEKRGLYFDLYSTQLRKLTKETNDREVITT